MRHDAAIRSLVVLLAMLGASPALAQVFMGDVMPPRAAFALARASGFEPLGPPVFQSGHYVMRAVDPVGTTVRLVVDAELGEIVSARPLDPRAPRYQPGAPVRVTSPYARAPRVATLPPGAEPADGRWGYDDPAALPPGRVPHVTGRPGGSAASAQGHTPLPRSRPMQAAKGPDIAAPVSAAPAGAESPSASPAASAPPAAAPAEAPEATGSVTPKAPMPALPPVQSLEE